LPVVPECCNNNGAVCDFIKQTEMPRTLQSIYSDLIPFINTKGTAIVEPDVYRVIRNQASQNT